MKKYIYESPDKGKTVYQRKFGKDDRKLIKAQPIIIEAKGIIITIPFQKEVVE